MCLSASDLPIDRAEIFETYASEEVFVRLMMGRSAWWDCVGEYSWVGANLIKFCHDNNEGGRNAIECAAISGRKYPYELLVHLNMSRNFG